MLRCVEAWWHGCLGNVWRDWKYYTKLKQSLKRKYEKMMQKMPRIGTRSRGKSLKLGEKSSQKVSWGSQLAKIGIKGRQGMAKGRPRCTKMAPRRHKGSPRWRPKGDQGRQNEAIVTNFELFG